MWVEELINDKISKHDFDMIQNIRRAGRSTTKNIAEGFGRHHHKENIQFCRISRGSLFEIREDLNICCDEGILKKEEVIEGMQLINDAIYSINGYTKYLRTLL